MSLIRKHVAVLQAWACLALVTHALVIVKSLSMVLREKSNRQINTSMFREVAPITRSRDSTNCSLTLTTTIYNNVHS